MAKQTRFVFTYKVGGKVKPIAGHFDNEHINQVGTHVVVFKPLRATGYVTQVLYSTLTPESIAEIKRLQGLGVSRG